MPPPPNASPAPIPPAPAPPAYGIAALFAFRDVKRRWPFAWRAAVCMGLPVLIGWAAGDTEAGLMATIGTFTALYGSGRPYLYRAKQLGIIAVALAAAVGLGVWAASVTWVGVLTMTVIAMVTTYLSNALRIGPPGAYFFLLACTAGIALHAAHVSPWRIALLTLAGGALAWVVHMAGAIFSPRGPEKAAVAAAGNAVADFIAAIGTRQQGTARHWAAKAMYEAWTALVNEQPVRSRPDGTLARLRALNRDLHLLFAGALTVAATGEPMPASAADTARDLARRAQDPPPVPRDVEIPLGRPRPADLLREAARPGSAQFLTVVRVGVAALLAGSIGAALGLDRAYWAITAAVLVLAQGFDWARTAQRGLERMVGTWIGLLAAGLVLLVYPQGLWLVAVIVVLQLAIELSVPRNYALAVVFITPLALVIGSGGARVDQIGELLLARGVDTLVGCVMALAVFLVTIRVGSTVGLQEAMTAAVDGVRSVLPHLARGAVTTSDARMARRDLQHRTLALAETYEARVGVSAAQQRAAEVRWPAVVAIQRLAYRTLSACWALERLGGDAAREAADAMVGPSGAAEIDRTLGDLTTAIRDGRTPMPPAELPGFLGAEVTTVCESLVRDARPL